MMRARSWFVGTLEVSLLSPAARALATVEALNGPFPHYGRKSSVVFAGSRVTRQGVWLVEERSGWGEVES